MELIKKIDDNLLQRIDENLPSFGGNTLPQNIVKAETALQEMEPIQQIWNHKDFLRNSTKNLQLTQTIN